MTLTDVATALVALGVFVFLLPWLPMVAVRTLDAALWLNARLFGWDAGDWTRRTSAAYETVPCWRCGSDRYTFEACRECGALGSEQLIEEAGDEILRDQLAETIEDLGLSEQAAEAVESKVLDDESDGGQP